MDKQKFLCLTVQDSYLVCKMRTLRNKAQENGSASLYKLFIIYKNRMYNELFCTSVSVCTGTKDHIELCTGCLPYTENSNI